MKTTVKVYEKGQLAYIPKKIIESGFKGEISILVDAATIVFIHPEATLDDVERSLLILVDDVRLRKKMGVSLKNQAKD